jgi:hypothetical protein
MGLPAQQTANSCRQIGWQHDKLAVVRGGEITQGLDVALAE